MVTKQNYKAAGKISINQFLQEKLKNQFEQEISNSKIRRLIASGQVYVDGKQCRIPSFSLRQGNLVTVNIDTEKLMYEKQPEDIDFTLTEKDVLFEDDFIIVVNKPAFLPTEQTIVGNRKNLHDCVVDYLWKKNPSLRNPPYVGIMHRLDRETSGVILFTKSRQANKGIFSQFENHTETKKYVALVETSKVENSTLKKNQNVTVEKYMARVSPKSSGCKMGIVSASYKDAQISKTVFSILKTSPDKTYVLAELFTGRTHQIRLHLSSLNVPIIGDVTYGGKRDSRIFLHCCQLDFIHPISNQKISCKAEVPF